MSATSSILRYGLNGISRLGTLHPMARKWRENVEVVRDVPYLPGGSKHHTLDIYRPAQHRGPMPVMVYIHGGGFRILSKDTHWMFGYGFAQRGWLVFNINYRLAPEHRFPTAVEDTAAALQWIAAKISAYGGDADRLALAGESAGANLALSLAICGCWPRTESFARQVFDLDVRPYAVVAACGLLQVSHPERYLQRTDIPSWVRARVQAVCRGYLPDDTGDPARFELADPLRVLESDQPPQRPLPAIFAPCGRSDPIADDSRRLAAALSQRGASFEAPWYDGHHAFHAFIWTEQARRCWADQDVFLRRYMPGTAY
ncbi:MAG: alpha/beta hydrolase [Myxococcota bacterium]